MTSVTAAFAASGWADGDDAVAEAIAAARGGLSGEQSSLVLVFPDVAIGPDAVAAQVAAAGTGTLVAGMTSDMTMTDGRVAGDGCAAIAFGAGMVAGVGLAERASGDPREAGRIATARAVEGVDLRPGHSVVLLFVDPAAGDEAAAIAGAYSFVGPSAPLAGGGANGRAVGLIAGEAFAADAVVAVALSSPEPIGVGFAHGCRVSGAPAIATRTEGRAVRELNGRPAEAVYLEELGHPGAALDDGEFEALAVLHPLAQPELRGGLRLRHVMGRARGGGLACATTIPPNAGVCFTQQSQQTIVSSATEAVRAARQSLGGPPRAGLVFDCAARKRALGARLGEEAAALQAAFGNVPALTGVYTRGEIGRTRGATGDRNHVVVAVAFA
jgi:hypothetical protein